MDGQQKKIAIRRREIKRDGQRAWTNDEKLPPSSSVTPMHEMNNHLAKIHDLFMISDQLRRRRHMAAAASATSTLPTMTIYKLPTTTTRSAPGTAACRSPADPHVRDVVRFCRRQRSSHRNCYDATPGDDDERDKCSMNHLTATSV